MEKENEQLKTRKKEIQDKMQTLDVDFRQKAEEKDEEVKKEKEELMAKLQSL